MPGTTGPRLIHHVAEEEQPTLDPRLVPRAVMVDEVKAHMARLADMRTRILNGEVDSSDLPAFHRALEDSIAWVAQASAELPDAIGGTEAFMRDLPRELRKIRLEYIQTSQHDPGARKLLPVAVKGSTRKGTQLGYFKSPLEGGRYGYLQRRGDDCLRAALATCVQAPMPEVPDLNHDQLLAAGRDPEEIARVAHRALGVWAERNGLTIFAHTTRLPVASPLWIGYVHDDRPNNRHALVFHGREVVFDTAWLVPPRTDQPVSWWGLDDIEVGLTIERR